jgi:hypothetical protein
MVDKRAHQQGRVSSSRATYRDRDGRKIGHMWPEEFEALCASIWGTDGWIGDVARYAGLSRDMVDHYRHGRHAIPRYLAQLIRLRYHVRKQAKAVIPENEAPWLKEGWEPYG